MSGVSRYESGGGTPEGCSNVEGCCGAVFAPLLYLVKCFASAGCLGGTNDLKGRVTTDETGYRGGGSGSGRASGYGALERDDDY